MFINPTLVDLSSDSCAALQLGDTCSAYNEANQVVYEHPHTSNSLALQSAQTACWQSAEVQSCFGVEEWFKVPGRSRIVDSLPIIILGLCDAPQID